METERALTCVAFVGAVALLAGILLIRLPLP